MGRIGGINRNKFLGFGFAQAILVPVVYRLSVSSNVLRESLIQYGFEYPPNDRIRKLVNAATKSIKEDLEMVAAGVDINQSNLSPVSNSHQQVQQPSQDHHSQGSTLDVHINRSTQDPYQNQNSTPQNNPYSDNYPVNNQYNSWSDTQSSESQKTGTPT